MRAFRVRAVALAVGLLFMTGTAGVARGEGSYRLTATNNGANYAPTFTGNGMLGVRVPDVGQGYAGGQVPAQSELAGFYAQPPGDVQQRANIPTWSTLGFSDGGQTFSLTSGHTANWRQSIDLHTGIVSTSADWTAPNGHVTHLSYQVLTDRARPFVGLVRLTLIPRWTGTATVTDEIDGTPANLTTQVDKGWATGAHRDWVSVKTEGTYIVAALSSQLQASANVTGAFSQVEESIDQSVGQQVSFPVTSGDTYTLTKYVGIASSQTSANAANAAQARASSAAGTGYGALLGANRAAWSSLWRGRIDIQGNPALATDVNASEFYLWSSTRAGVNWSVSPAGLSSNGYDGHIFWDAETWMFPTLLAQHPNLAAGMNNYRFERLGAAEQHAQATGYQGARFPWESALDGTEQIPPPVSVNSEGLYEQHITADIALAQWQYYLASGDRQWLRNRGWPVLSQAATFWASRVTRAADGSYHINHVTGPDEENPDVNDEVYTNVAAITTLRNATQAAELLGLHPPARWSQIASKLVVLTNRRPGYHPEFKGYQSQLVKQADVTLIQYPWADPIPRAYAINDINFYVPRTDPGGPSMSDAVNSIDTSSLGTPGCSSFVYTERSYEPFIRDVFDQFSETSTGGAFTFMTGIGGFLQEFLYGYTGFRTDRQGVTFEPSLTRQLRGIVLRNVLWQGRRMTVSLGQRISTIRLLSGPALTVTTPSGIRHVATGQSLRVPTRRPDLLPTSDAVRCGQAKADSTQPGAPALAAVDGSPATDWQPTQLPATLTAPFAGGAQRVNTATLRWGRQWPAAPGPNVPPPPGPITVLRPSSYQLLVSADGSHWRVVASVQGRAGQTLDVLHFGSVRARFARVRVLSSSQSKTPMLDELMVTG